MCKIQAVIGDIRQPDQIMEKLSLLAPRIASQAHAGAVLKCCSNDPSMHHSAEHISPRPAAW